MIFSVNKKALAGILSSAGEATGKGSMSIVNTVLLELTGDTLQVSATDVKVWFSSSLTVQGKADGKVAVFVDKITAILSSLPDGEVLLSYKDNKLTLKPDSKKATYKLATMGAQSFPDRPVNQESANFTIPAVELKEIVNKTLFAVSNDESRAFMVGVYLCTEDGNLRSVATDGRRLSLVNSIYIQDFTGVIVPTKVLLIASKQAQPTDEVKVTVSEKNITFTYGETTLSSTLIEGQFPSYQKVIPEGYTELCTIDKVDLISAIKRVAVMAEQKASRIYFEYTENSLTVSSENGDTGEATEELDAVCTLPMKQAFNYNYVLDALKAVDGDTVIIKYADPARAILIESGNGIGVIMPQSADN